MERTFLDTNVFVYADDLDAAHKREVAQSVIGDAFGSAAGVVSTQEFFVVSTKKSG